MSVAATRQPGGLRAAGSPPRQRNPRYFAGVGFAGPLTGRLADVFCPWTGFFVAWCLLAPLVMALLLVASGTMNPLRYRNVKSVDA